MGRNLKKKKLDKGICQRKDGLYMARFVDRYGKRRQKCFKSLQECRRWLAESREADEAGGFFSPDITVDEWFGFWLSDVKRGSVRESTVQEYASVYKNRIKPRIGTMRMRDVAPVHCQVLLNALAAKNKTATVSITKAVLQSLFCAAAESGIIAKNPVTKNVRAKGKDADRICGEKQEGEREKVLTVEEQRRFLAEAEKDVRNYPVFAFILQTGLRVGEINGLQWEDADLKNRVLHVRRAAKNIGGRWIVGPPKSKSGERDIPLTEEAVNIIRRQKAKVFGTDSVIPIEHAEGIFECRHAASYAATLEKICERAGVPRISIHSLRHTYATRCVEAGMDYKTLQVLMGHSSIGTTMNLYVHMTEDEKIEAVKSVEKMLSFNKMVQ